MNTWHKDIVKPPGRGSQALGEEKDKDTLACPAAVAAPRPGSLAARCRFGRVLRPHPALALHGAGQVAGGSMAGPRSPAASRFQRVASRARPGAANRPLHLLPRRLRPARRLSVFSRCQHPLRTHAPRLGHCACRPPASTAASSRPRPGPTPRPALQKPRPRKTPDSSRLRLKNMWQ